MALRYGRGHYTGLHTELLMRTEVFPVCAPSLLRGGHPLREPQDLQHHALIHDETLAHDSSCPDWAMWLRAAGVTGVDPARGLRFNAVALSLDAAAAGRGVVLTRSIFAADDLAAGRLVRPFGAGMPTDFAVYLVTPPALVSLPKVKLFRDWVFAEVEPTKPSAEVEAPLRAGKAVSERLRPPARRGQRAAGARSRI
jgi:LysR family glycine cleavage system transcriptional activator